MPPTLIPAPSFNVDTQDPDFETDFDLPEGETIIAPAPPVDINGTDLDGEEDWDREFSPEAETDLPFIPSKDALVASRRGSVTKISSAPAQTEEWDDDDDFDLPPPSSKPLKLSLSPRTKIKQEAATKRQASPRPITDSNPVQEEDAEAGDASTIKVSRLALSAAFASTSQQLLAAAPKMVHPTVSPKLPEDMEDDLIIPNDLSHLALKPQTTLSHRASKISFDGWGDTTTSTLFSDGSGTSSQPSSCGPSQASTEDESEGFGDEDDDFDGLVLPDSLSSRDMNKKLEDKKSGMAPVSKDTVRVARLSDGEDDFEAGLVIGPDEDLSPSRLKNQFLSGKRAVGKGTVRSLSEPQRNSSGQIVQAFARPPSRLREEIVPSGRTSSASTSRESATSPTLVLPPLPSSKADHFPTLRRAPSSISSRPAQGRSHTLTSALRPSPSIILPSHFAHRPNSPTKVPPPYTTVPTTSPFPIPPPPSSPGSASSSRARLSPTLVKHQKSYSKMSSNTTQASSSKKLGRKASMSSIDTSQSLAPSPEIPFASSSKGTLRRVQGGLNHASSYRELGGAATVGPSSSNTTVQSRKYAYEAPTVASRVRRSGKLPEDSFSEMSGSDRERVKSVAAPSSGRSLTRNRGTISNVFPGVTVPPSSPTALSPSTARSPSPRQPVKKPSFTAATASSAARRAVSISAAQVPVVKVLKRPNKPRVFGDGTELDSIEDLTVESEKENKFRVVPSGRGNVKQTTKLRTLEHASSSATIGRRRGAGETALVANTGPRPTSSASTATTITTSDAPRPTPTLRKQRTVQFPRSDASSALPAPTDRRRKPTTAPGLDAKTKKKPTLIRNLSGAAAPKVIGDMKWNPISQRWEGNDAVLRDFEPASSTRPALITHLTGSSMGGFGSPPGSLSSLASGVRVVGEMLFDPVKMCWISRTGDEEDPFAGMDDDDWDAEEKGATIRITGNPLSDASLAGGSDIRTSGMSSEGSSPARSHRGSHGPSASESDSESITGSVAGTNGGRSSSLGGAMLTISEHEDATLPLPRELVKACAVAEERHRSEMRGWHVSPSTSRRRVSNVRGSAPPAEADELDRSYLWDIRALATRNY